MPVFVGIDPSLASTGVAVIGKGQPKTLAIPTKPAKGARQELDRLKGIVHAVEQILLDEKPEAVAMEGTVNFGQGNHSPIIGLNYLFRAMLDRFGFKTYIISPSTLKKFVTLKGSAKKEDMRLAAFKKWNFEAKTNDEVDAYALAVAAEILTIGTGTKADRETLSKHDWI